MRKFLAITTLVPLLLAGAPLAVSAAPALSPEQRALSDNQRELVAATCDRIMGLSSGGLYREECMDSLARSVARRVARAQMVASYAACSRQGLHEGTPGFSTCMLDTQDRRGAMAAEPVRLTYDWNTPENSRGYFDVTNSVHWRREQYACAQIGLTPGTASFGQCTASLEGALSPNPR